MTEARVSQRLNKMQRLQMLEQALKDKAPQTYLKLKTSGRIESFLEKHDEEMMESFYRAYGEAYYQILLKNGDKGKTEQALELEQIEKFNDAVATWKDFRDPEDSKTTIKK